MNFFKSLFGGNQSKENNKETDNKKNFDILKYDGIRAFNIHKLAYSIRCFEEALDIQDDAETMEFLANAYMSDNNTKDAITILERLSELTPTDIKPLLSLASVHYMEEDYEKMNEACNKALVLDEKNISALYLNAKALIGLKNEIMAIAMLTKAISIKDDYLDAYILRASTLFSMKQINDAKEDIEHILSVDADNETTLLLQGEISACENNMEEALGILDHVLSINPFNEKAYLIKGNMLINNKEFDKAIGVYNEALEITPNFAKAYHERGRAKMLKGDKDGSLEDMKKAMELAPESEGNINGEYNNYDNITKNVPW